ncbi:MAG TPA: hypothetical protein VKZ54_03115, partial [Membranihabitans sp.]|nr:hypothetical protein [Membranihabitans sp.]
RKFRDMEGFAKVMSIEEVMENKGNLSLQLYVQQTNGSRSEHSTKELLAQIRTGQEAIDVSMTDLYRQLK